MRQEQDPSPRSPDWTETTSKSQTLETQILEPLPVLNQSLMEQRRGRGLIANCEDLSGSIDALLPYSGNQHTDVFI